MKTTSEISVQPPGITRAYQRWFSPHLNREMELLVFGTGGTPVIFFPTRMARFYDYEDWGVIASLQEKIMGGHIQVVCLDSIDYESFYNKSISPSERILRHIEFESYVLDEVIPFIKESNPAQHLISAGCSLGAYHAMNIYLRNPHLFIKMVGMSGRYDLTIQMDYFDDLFEGYWDENIYYNMPMQYVANLKDQKLIDNLKHGEIIMAVGEEDAFVDFNMQMSNILSEKDIPNALHLWNGEAHKAKYWSRMVQWYL